MESENGDDELSPSQAAPTRENAQQNCHANPQENPQQNPHENTPSGWAFVLAILGKETLSARRGLNAIALPLTFCIIVASLFPLAIDPDPVFLRKIAPGAIWIAALLSTLLIIDGMWASDYDSGVLEIIAISPNALPDSLVLFGFAKAFSLWLIGSVPLLLVSLIVAAMLNIPLGAMGYVALSLLLGTPILSFIGAIGAALTLSLNSAGALLALIVLPLTIPVLLFGTHIIQTAIDGQTANASILLLAAILTLTLTLSPFAIAAALRAGLE